MIPERSFTTTCGFPLHLFADEGRFSALIYVKMNGRSMLQGNTPFVPDEPGMPIPPEDVSVFQEPVDVPGIPEVNDSEAGNLAFILSDRISRHSDWRLMIEPEADESAAMTELADRISRRLEELSMRLGDEIADRMLDRKN